MAKRQSERRTAQEWAREVAAWRESGLTARAFARRRGLKAATLSWWGWRLRREESALARRELALLPVEVVEEAAPAAGGGGWELVTADGHRLRGDGSVSPESIVALVGALTRGR